MADQKEEITLKLQQLQGMENEVNVELNKLSIKMSDLQSNKVKVEADIHREIELVHQQLDQRRVELVAGLQQLTQQKMRELATKRDQMSRIQSQISSCLEYAEAGLKAGSEQDMLRMKSSVLKQITQIAAELYSRDVKPTVGANIELVTNHSTTEACKDFGTLNFKLADVGSEALYDTIDEYQVRVNQVYSLSHRTELGTECTVNQAYGALHQARLDAKSTTCTKHTSSISSSQRVKSSSQSLQRPFMLILGSSGPFSVAQHKGQHLVAAQTMKHRISVITKQGVGMFSFGGYGTKKGQFKCPSGVTVDYNSNIYIVDNGNSRIQKFDAEGKFKAFVGSHGNGNLQFNSPIGICYNNTTGNVYVCDEGNNRVQVLTTDLKFVKSFGVYGTGFGKFKHPKNIDFDTTNNLYITDCDNNRVQVFTADGHFLRAFSSKANGKMNKPYDITIDNNDTVFVSELDGEYLNVFTAEGSYVQALNVMDGQSCDSFKGVYHLCIDHDDRLIVTKGK